MKPNSLAQLRRALEQERAGHPQAAEELYRAVVQADPSNPDAPHLLGLLALQKGNPQAAVDWISKAIRLSPKTALYQNNLGLAFRALGRLSEAASSFNVAGRLDPRFFDAHFNLGVVLQTLERVDEAIAAYEKALLARKDLGALNNLGGAYRQRGEFPAAIRRFKQALEIQPEDADALYNLAMVLQESGQGEKAIEFFERRARLPNPPPELPVRLGTLLQQIGRPSEAEAWYRRSLSAQPSPTACNNLAILLNQRFALAEAEQLLRLAIGLRPDDAEAFSNLGNVLLDAGRPAEAEAAYDQAIQIKPGYVDAIYNRAHARLILGDFDSGLSDYEYRWLWKGFPSPKPNFRHPEWAGEELNGRTLLVYNEQGLGDTIQFSRYFAAAARGARVLFACPAPLRTLFQDMPGLSGFVEADQPLPTFDVHAALMSLPRLCGTRSDNIPHRVPYLLAPPAERFPLPPRTSRRLRVGIVWAGGSLHTKDAMRSMTLSDLLPLLRSVKCDFYSLQAGAKSGELASLSEDLQIEDIGSRVKDFADTATVMGQLDLILSVSTSTQHLAGALAKPVWGLLSCAPDWRWMLEREDSPWYPTMRLFRQTKLGDWRGVLERVRLDLERLALRYELENLPPGPPPPEWFLPLPAPSTLTD